MYVKDHNFFDLFVFSSTASVLFKNFFLSFIAFFQSRQDLFFRNFIFFDLLYLETKALFSTNFNFRFRRSHRCSHQQLVHHEYHSTDSFSSCKFFFNFFYIFFNFFSLKYYVFSELSRSNRNNNKKY